MKSMKMKNDIRRSVQTIAIDPEKKERSMRILSAAVEKKRLMPCGRRAFWYYQIKYMDKSVMAGHALACILLLLIQMILRRRDVDVEQAILFSIIFSVTFGVVTLEEIGHIFYTGIAELSESCYFNAKQIVAIHMLLSGILNLTFLLLGTLFVGYQWKIGFVQTGLYFLTPFVIAQSVCLKILLSETGRRNTGVLPAVGIFLVVCCLSLSMIPGLYQAVMLTAWAAAFVVGTSILTIQVKKLFQKMEKGEILCTN